MGVEDRLGIQSPGFPDDEPLKEKRLSDLTLRDLVRLVEGYVPAGADLGSTAERLVLEAAEKVAAHQVTVSEIDLPLLQAMWFSRWAEKHSPKNVPLSQTFSLPSTWPAS